jgi:hypothetical protein
VLVEGNSAAFGSIEEVLVDWWVRILVIEFSAIARVQLAAKAAILAAWLGITGNLVL